MRKVELIETVKKNLIKLDKNNLLHDELVSRFIATGMNQILYDTFRKVPGELDLMSKIYTIDVEDGESELPVSVYQLPNYAQIRRFALLSLTPYMIVPQPLNGESFYSNLEVGLIDTTPSFSLSSQKIFFQNLPEEIVQLKVWVIPSFEDLDYEDEVYIPSGKSIDLYGIIQQLAGSSQPANLNNK